MQFRISVSLLTKLFNRHIIMSVLGYCGNIEYSVTWNVSDLLVLIVAWILIIVGHC